MTVQAMVLQPDGKIVIGGRAGNDFALMRLKPDGSTDSSFGGSTGVRADLGGYDYVTGLAIDVDGKVVAVGAGHGAAGSGHTIVRRYNADGSRDTGFQNVDRAFGLDDEAVGSRGARRREDRRRRQLDGCERQRRAGAATGERRHARPELRHRRRLAVRRRCASDRGDLVVRSDGRVVVVGSLHTGGARQLALLRFQGDTATAPRPAQGYVVDGYGSPLGFSAGCAARAAAPDGQPVLGRLGRRPRDRGAAGRSRPRGRRVRWPAPLPVRRRVDGRPAGLGQRHVGEPGHGAGRGRRARRHGWLRRGPDRSPASVQARFRRTSRRSPAGCPRGRARTSPAASRCCPTARVGTCSTRPAVCTRSAAHRPPAPACRHGPVRMWRGASTIAPDGSGGWVVDAYGGMHAFGIGGNAKPPAAVGGPYWPGVKIARGVAALP